MSDAVYLESSALLSWLLGEPEGEVVRRTVDRTSVVVTSRLTLVEATRGLLRAEHDQRISAAERHTLTGLLAAGGSAWRWPTRPASAQSAQSGPFPSSRWGRWMPPTSRAA